MKTLTGNLTGKQIRQQIAGQEIKTVLATNGQIELIHHVDFRGWFDDAFAIHSFQIVNKNMGLFLTFPDLQPALSAWDRICSE